MSGSWRQRKRVVLLKLALMDGQPTAPCCHCCTHFTKGKLTLDHIVPRSQGGKYVLDNVALACADCNEERGDEDFEEFRTRKRAERGLA
jgi:5-methylcytosine-specific restriction endonuclease McrA